MAIARFISVCMRWLGGGGGGGGGRSNTEFEYLEGLNNFYISHTFGERKLNVAETYSLANKSDLMNQFLACESRLSRNKLLRH